MATRIDLGSGPLYPRAANGARARPRGRWRLWLATLLIGSTVWVASPDAEAAGPQRKPPAARFQPPLPEGRARPASDQRVVANARVGKATVTVVVVHATPSGPFNPQLEGLRRQLQNQGFTGAQILTTQSGQVGPDQSTTASVQGGYKVQATLLEYGEEQSRVRIVMLRNGEKKLDTTASQKNGRAFTVGGPNYDGGRMLFAVTVK